MYSLNYINIHKALGAFFIYVCTISVLKYKYTFFYINKGDLTLNILFTKSFLRSVSFLQTFCFTEV